MTTFEEQNWIETWLIRPSPGFRGIKISKFIADPYNLASLLFILAIFIGKATQMQGGVPFPKALFPLQSDAEN